MEKTRNKNRIKSFSLTEKEAARNLSTLEYFKREYGFSFKKSGRGYRCIEHDSLFIYPDEKGWFWNSRQIGGADVIDAVRKLENKLYPEALEKLLGTSSCEEYFIPGAPIKHEIENRQLELPNKAQGQYNRLFAYLCKTRGLDSNIIGKMVDEHKLYQDENGNVVAVGYNEDNAPAFATKRGTLTVTDKKFRGDCSGSDKRYTFTLCPAANSDRLYIFESFIEVLSHASMENLIFKDKDMYKRRNRISLNGLSDVALAHYLEKHPEVKILHFCLNNDNTANAEENRGQDAAQKLIDKYRKKGYVCFNHKPPENCNDYNDALLLFKKKPVLTKYSGSEKILKR